MAGIRARRTSTTRLDFSSTTPVSTRLPYRAMAASTTEGSGGIDADDQAVWVSDYLARTLWRLPLN